MLTALSVARECSLVDNNEQVICVKAVPPQGDDPATCSFETTSSMVRLIYF